jgi:hypothetical protein
VLAPRGVQPGAHARQIDKSPPANGTYPNMHRQSGALPAIPERLFQKVLRLAKADDRSKALQADIESVANGGEVSPEPHDDGRAERLLTGESEMKEHPETVDDAPQPLARLVIYDPKTGIPLDPQPGEQAKNGLLSGENTKKPGRGGNVPPEAHRFKPGRSGNPSGRPRNSTSQLMRDLLEAGDQKYAKQIVKALVEKACQGNLAAIRELLNRSEPPYGGRASCPALFEPYGVSKSRP